MIIIPILQIRETEAQSPGVFCLRWHSQKVMELGLNPRGADPKSPRFQPLQDKEGVGLGPRPVRRGEGGGEAEDPAGREPWTGPAVAMGTAGRRRRAGLGAQQGSSGEFPPAAGSRPSRHLGPRSRSPRGLGGPQAPRRHLRLLRPELDPRRSRTYLQFICMNYLLRLAASPAASRPPPPSALRGPATSPYPGWREPLPPDPRSSNVRPPRGSGQELPTFSHLPPGNLCPGTRESTGRGVLPAILSIGVTGNHPPFHLWRHRRLEGLRNLSSVRPQKEPEVETAPVWLTLLILNPSGVGCQVASPGRGPLPSTRSRLGHRAGSQPGVPPPTPVRGAGDTGVSQAGTAPALRLLLS